MACHITGVYDVNRNNTLKSDDYTHFSQQFYGGNLQKVRK
jgi:hypothetical protein